MSCVGSLSCCRVVKGFTSRWEGRREWSDVELVPQSVGAPGHLSVLCWFAVLLSTRLRFYVALGGQGEWEWCGTRSAVGRRPWASKCLVLVRCLTVDSSKVLYRAGIGVYAPPHDGGEQGSAPPHLGGSTKSSRGSCSPPCAPPRYGGEHFIMGGSSRGSTFF